DLIADHVARRKNVVDMAPQELVHLHFSVVAQGHARPFNGYLVRVGTSASRHKQPLGTEFALLSIKGYLDRDSRPGRADLADRRLRPHVDSFRPEDFADSLADFRLIAAQKRLAAL